MRASLIYDIVSLSVCSVYGYFFNLRGTRAMKTQLKIAVRLKRVATLPCEMSDTSLTNSRL